MAYGKRSHERGGVCLENAEARPARNGRGCLHAGLPAFGRVTATGGIAAMATGSRHRRLRPRIFAGDRSLAVAVARLRHGRRVGHGMGCSRAPGERRQHARHCPADAVQHQGEGQEDAQGQGRAHDPAILPRAVIRR